MSAARELASYRVDEALLDPRRPARSPCTTFPPTPARRSPPRSSTVTRQRIWDQAENRRHAQKALLELLVAPA